VTQSFDAYIRNLENWSLDPAVLRVYPELAGMAWFSPVGTPEFGTPKIDAACTCQ